MRFLGKLRHEKSGSLMRVKGFGVCLCDKRNTKSLDDRGDSQFLECVSRKCVQKFDLLVFRKGVAYRIIS